MSHVTVAIADDKDEPDPVKRWKGGRRHSVR